MSEFRLLGPVEAQGPAGEVRLGGGVTVRVVFAILLLRAGQLVSRDALVDALWPDDPPPSARQTVESYVSRLRRALREAGLDSTVIESAPTGYRLVLNGYGIDRDRFDALVASGRDARSRGDAVTAAARLDEALALWRGPALDGLADRPALSADAAALTQARLLALEAWAELQLELGHVAEVIAKLQFETGRHPRRERLHELLMLALYRSGSQAEALEHYAAVRRHLVDELGLEPGPALRDMQQRILRQDRTLEREARTPDRPPALVPARRRRPAPLVAAAVALLTVVGAAAWVAGGGDPQEGSAAAAVVAGSPALAVVDPVAARTGGATALPAVAARMTTGLGARWITAPDDGTLLRVDHSGVVTQTVRVGHGPLGVTTALGDVWVAAARDGQVVRVDGATNRVVQRIAVGASPAELAAADGVVWVADGREPTVTRIDARTGDLLGSTTLRGEPGGLAVGFGAVWVSEPSAGRVAQLDAGSGRVREEIPVGSGPGPIAAGPEGLWVANVLDSTVSLVDPARGAVTFTSQVRGIATAIAVRGRQLWVAAGDAPALTRLAVDAPARVLALPSTPTALSADGRTLLVALRPGGRSHRGGTLRVRSATPLDQPDTHVCCDGIPALRNASYDALLGISVVPGSTGALVPNLALAVPRPQDGGRTYTFHLRPDLRYWTGRRVRASDFRRGLELAAASDSTLAGYLDPLPRARDCARRGAHCDLRAAVSTDDDAATVTLHLDHPDPELLWRLALSYFAPSPTSHGPIPGTGPYRIAQIVRKRLVDLRRNRYFRERAPAAQPDGFPDRIVWQLGGTPEGAVADVIAGRADYTGDPPTRRQFDELRVRAPAQLHSEPVAGDEYAWLNTRARPFDDIRVRRALSYAVDRGALARLWGAGARPLCQIIPTSIPGHVSYCPYTRRPTEDGRWSAPDLAKARALIAASHTRGMAITYYAFAGVTGTATPVDAYLVSLLRRLGYRVTLRALNQNRWPTVINDAGRHIQIGAGSWWADIPSASQWTQLLSCASFDPGSPEGNSNPAGFCDPVVDRWTRRASRLQSTDPAAANRLWARADRRITDQAPWVPTIQPATVDTVATGVGGYQTVPTIGVLPHRLWVR